MLILLTFTAPSSPCGVVITKFSGHAVTFRSSPMVVADTSMSRSATTCILFGKPPIAMWSAATLFGLYRMRFSRSLPLPTAECRKQHTTCSCSRRWGQCSPRCCARAASGHATAVPPNSVMKSRRLMCSSQPMGYSLSQCRVVHHSILGRPMSQMGQKRRGQPRRRVLLRPVRLAKRTEILGVSTCPRSADSRHSARLHPEAEEDKPHRWLTKNNIKNPAAINTASRIPTTIETIRCRRCAGLTPFALAAFCAAPIPIQKPID
jgi:hypothetical protein